MVTCGNYMHKFSVSKDVKKITMIKGEGRWHRIYVQQ